MVEKQVSAIMKILMVLLAISLLGNVYLGLFYHPVGDPSEQALLDQTNNLTRQVAELSERVNQDNITIRGYTSQLDTYRQMVTDLQTQLNTSSSLLQGFAVLQGPAVLQDETGTITQGTMLNISVEIRPGQGRVLVETKPLMGIVFQDAANTAVFVAQNVTGKSLTGSDVIFSVEAQDQVPAVDGPSAGALMTALTIAALTGQDPNPSVTLTGTIDSNGHVGAIGGVVEKAQAAKDSGKSELLLPRENAQLVQYTETTRRIGRFTYIARTPNLIDAKQYIEKEIGIQVTYVDTINDVQKYLGLQIE
jgi:predicted S18 family serine protease